MFDHLSYSKFAVTVICVRDKASVCPFIPYNIVMYVVVKGDVFEFILLGSKNNGIVLCDLRQEWFDIVAMYKTRIPNANAMKKVRWEGIKLCEIFGGARIFSRESGSFKGAWVIHRKEEKKSWGLDHLILYAVEPCRYVLIILAPSGHGAVKIMH